MQTNIAIARKRLLQHAFLDEDSDDLRVTRGFLGALRPFDGTLHEENFHDVMDCLRTLADELGNAARLDRDLIAALWSLPTALAFLAWFVFAPQCLSTIAVARRETNGWTWPIVMVVYLFALAWLAAGATFWIATALGL